MLSKDLGGSAAEVEDPGQLVDVVGAGEEGLAGQHLRHDAAHAPQVNCLHRGR